MVSDGVMIVHNYNTLFLNFLFRTLHRQTCLSNGTCLIATEEGFDVEREQNLIYRVSLVKQVARRADGILRTCGLHHRILR